MTKDEILAELRALRQRWRNQPDSGGADWVCECARDLQAVIERVEAGDELPRSFLRLWHLSRTIARRLRETKVKDVREMLGKLPPEMDDLPAAFLFSFTGALEILQETAKIAGWPDDHNTDGAIEAGWLQEILRNAQRDVDEWPEWMNKLRNGNALDSEVRRMRRGECPDEC